MLMETKFITARLLEFSGKDPQKCSHMETLFQIWNLLPNSISLVNKKMVLDKKIWGEKNAALEKVTVIRVSFSKR